MVAAGALYVAGAVGRTATVVAGGAVTAGVVGAVVSATGAVVSATDAVGVAEAEAASPAVSAAAGSTLAEGGVAATVVDAAGRRGVALARADGVGVASLPEIATCQRATPAMATPSTATAVKTNARRRFRFVAPSMATNEGTVGIIPRGGGIEGESSLSAMSGSSGGGGTEKTPPAASWGSSGRDEEGGASGYGGGTADGDSANTGAIGGGGPGRPRGTGGGGAACAVRPRGTGGGGAAMPTCVRERLPIIPSGGASATACDGGGVAVADVNDETLSGSGSMLMGAVLSSSGVVGARNITGGG